MIYWKFKYSRTQRALAVGVSAVVKDIPDKACIKTDYLIGTGLTSEVKAKLRELIKAGF